METQEFSTLKEPSILREEEERKHERAKQFYQFKVRHVLTDPEGVEQNRAYEEAFMSQSKEFIERALGNTRNALYVERVLRDWYETHQNKAHEINHEEMEYLRILKNKSIYLQCQEEADCVDGRENTAKRGKIPGAADGNIMRSPAGYPTGYVDGDRYMIDGAYKNHIRSLAANSPYVYIKHICHGGCAAACKNEQDSAQLMERNPMKDGGLYYDVHLKSTITPQLEHLMKPHHKLVLTSMLTTVPKNGNMLLGLEKEEARMRGSRDSEGYTDQVLGELIDQKVILSSLHMVQTSPELNEVFADLIRVSKEHLLGTKNVSLDLKGESFMSTVKVTQRSLLAFLLPEDPSTLKFLSEIYPHLTHEERGIKKEKMKFVMDYIGKSILEVYPEFAPRKENHNSSQGHMGMEGFFMELTASEKNAREGSTFRTLLRELAESLTEGTNDKNAQIIEKMLNHEGLGVEEGQEAQMLSRRYYEAALFEEYRRELLESAFHIFLLNPAARWKEQEKLKKAVPSKISTYPYSLSEHEESVGQIKPGNHQDYEQQRFTFSKAVPGHVTFTKNIIRTNRLAGRVRAYGFEEEMKERPEDFSYVYYNLRELDEERGRSDWQRFNSMDWSFLAENWINMEPAELEEYLLTTTEDMLSPHGREQILSLAQEMKNLYQYPETMTEDLQKKELLFVPALLDKYGEMLTVLPFWIPGVLPSPQ